MTTVHTLLLHATARMYACHVVSYVYCTHTYICVVHVHIHVICHVTKKYFNTA